MAALAWNDAIRTIFKAVFGTVETVPLMLSYAIIVTVIAVIMTLWISHMAEKAQKSPSKA